MNILITAGLLATIAQAAPTTSSPCTAIQSSDVFHKPSDILACIRTIPFDPAIRENVMGVVTNAFTMDIYQYNMLHDPSPALNQNLDLIKEFGRINGTAYSSDYDFQADLSAVVNRVNDGHYGWNGCYGFRTFHSLPIYAVASGSSAASINETKIHLAPDLPVFAKSDGVFDLYKAQGIDTELLADAEVVTIEGKAPFDHLVELAATSGGWQDLEQRLNSMMASFKVDHGAFTHDRGVFTSTGGLGKDSVSMQVKRTDGTVQDLVVPRLTRFTNFNYTTGQDFFNDNCLPESTLSDQLETEDNIMKRHAKRQFGSLSAIEQYIDSMKANITAMYEACPIVTNQTYPYASDPHQAAAFLGGRDVQFYLLANQSTPTGVLHVTTFSPEDDATGQPTIPCRSRFALDAYLGVYNLTKAGVQRLLIDTSGNGGGFIYLNQILQKLVSGDADWASKDFEFVARDSPISRAIMQASITSQTSTHFQPTQMNVKGQVEPLAANTNIFSPGLHRTVNNHTLYTSNAYQGYLQQAHNPSAEILNTTIKPSWTPADIVFVGNGLCGSACSLFTNYFLEYHNVRSYIAASRPQRPIEFSGWATTAAYDTDKLYSEAASSDLAADAKLESVMPAPLAVKGSFHYVIQSALSPIRRPGRFLQYVSNPAEKTYGMSKAGYLDPLGNWEWLAKQVFGDA